MMRLDGDLSHRSLTHLTCIMHSVRKQQNTYLESIIIVNNTKIYYSSLDNMGAFLYYFKTFYNSITFSIIHL